jgi:hypothetical protein
MKHIFAGNISALTGAQAFHGGAAPITPPSVEDVLADMKKTMSPTDYGVFNKMRGRVPEGFVLTPVYFVRAAETSSRVLREYEIIRPLFLSHVATTQRKELQMLGICDHGIDRMRRGLDPADVEERYYKVNVDHIVERQGCGRWSHLDNKKPDPDDAAAGNSAYPVNHFGNMILLPEHIHIFKNKINNLQHVHDLKPGDEGRWILMLAPEAPGFVCPPRKGGDLRHGLSFRQDDVPSRIKYMNYLLDRTNEALDVFTAQPIVGKALATFDEIAQRRGTSVLRVANDNNDPMGSERLRHIFSEIISHDTVADAQARVSVRPYLREIEGRLRSAFSKVSTRPYRPGPVKTFAIFYQTRRVESLRGRLSSLPFAEAASLQKALTEIDGNIPSSLLRPPSP